MKTYLISLDMTPAPAHMHSYVMSDDPQIIEKVCNRMVTEAEKQGFPVMLPMFCATPLGDSDAIVRDKLCEFFTGAAEALARVADFHITMWMLSKADPWDAELMKLH